MKRLDKNFNKLLFCIGLLFSETARPEASNILALDYGQDNEDGSLFSGLLDLSLPRDFNLSLGAGSDTISTDQDPVTTKQYSITLGHQYLVSARQSFNWSVGYREWGKKEEIESRDAILGLSFSNRRWSVAADFETGALELFIRPGFANRIRSIASDRRALRLTTAYTFKQATTLISYQQRKYEKDVSLLSSRVALQQALNGIALNQAYALSRNELLIAYEWAFERFDAGADYNRIISIVDNHKNTYAAVFIRYYTNNNVMLNARVEQEIGVDSTLLTAGIAILF